MATSTQSFQKPLISLVAVRELKFSYDNMDIESGSWIMVTSSKFLLQEPS